MTESEVREYCRFLFDQTPGNKQINMIRYTLNEIEKETVSHIETKYARIGNYQNLVQMPYDISELKDQLKEVLGDDYESIADGYHNALVDTANSLKEELDKPKLSRKNIETIWRNLHSNL